MQLYKYYILAITCCTILSATAQTPDQYPKGYFRNPLDIPIMLAGNFGECRANHFHSGLDIKTMGKENMPVYAAAEGYISRIKIEKGGFGHALYVTHPNGYTTVYAHLNKFMAPVQKYMRDEQFKTENWQVDLKPEPDQFPVKKGEQIALSGNTGGSTAPHLHFEVRNTRNEHPLNPQLFGFDIKDEIAPKPTQLAVYDMYNKVYEQTPKLFPLTQKGDSYTLSSIDTIIVHSDMTGIGVVVNDYMNGSTNTLTYHTATMYMNNAKFITVKLEDISYEQTRYMHAFIDYKSKKQTGEWIQLLFQMDGNRLDSVYNYISDYRRFTQRGKLEFSANGAAKEVRIELKDASDNISTIRFYIRYEAPAEMPAPKSCPRENTFYPFKEGRYGNLNFYALIDENALYETLCLDIQQKPDETAYSDRFAFHRSYVPLHTSAIIKIKPNKAIPFKLKDKVVFVYNDGKEESGTAGIFDNGWYRMKTRNFGEYRLVTDDTPPSITADLKKGSDYSSIDKISFTAKDNLTSIKTFRAELNGKWVPFEQAGDTFSYEFDEHTSSGKNKLVITTADESGNEETIKYTFTR